MLVVGDFICTGIKDPLKPTTAPEHGIGLTARLPGLQFTRSSLLSPSPPTPAPRWDPVISVKKPSRNRCGSHTRTSGITTGGYICNSRLVTSSLQGRASIRRVGLQILGDEWKSCTILVRRPFTWQTRNACFTPTFAARGSASTRERKATRFGPTF